MNIKLIFLLILLFANPLFIFSNEDYNIVPYHKKNSPLIEIKDINNFAKKHNIKIKRKGEEGYIFMLDPVLTLKKIYSQKVGGINFYRVLYDIYTDWSYSNKSYYELYGKENTPFTSQVLYYEKNGMLKPIDEREYYFIRIPLQDTPAVASRHNFMPFNRGGIYGYLDYGFSYMYRDINDREYRSGGGVILYYIEQDKNGNDTIKEKCSIGSMNDFLIDKKNPFRYTLQNAFDGDPATSYVENSKNDLIEIIFNFKEPMTLTQCKQIVNDRILIFLLSVSLTLIKDLSSPGVN